MMTPMVMGIRAAMRHARRGSGMLVVALAALILGSAPAHGSPFGEVVGKLAGETCARMVALPPNDAKALLIDAINQFTSAEQRYTEEGERAATAWATASEAQQLDSLARVEKARRELEAYRFAYFAIGKCYQWLAPSDAAVTPAPRDDVPVVVNGKWQMQCTYANDPKLISSSAGRFALRLNSGGAVGGEYFEEAGPVGQIQGVWKKPSHEVVLEGSTSAGLGETQGVWRGVLTFKDDHVFGGGEVRVNRRSVDLVCAGQWRAE